MAKKKPSEVVNRSDIPVDACVPHPQNYQGHPPDQIGRLRRSLRIFGQVASLVVQDRGDGTFLLVAGEGIHIAMLLEKFETLRADVIPPDWDDAKVTAYLAADNELARGSDPDQLQLAALVQSVHDELDEQVAALAAGSEERMLELLSKTQVAKPPTPDDDPGPQDASERLLEIWPVQEGQVWEIPSRSVPGGVHRLRCGDSADRYGLAKLAAGAVGDWVWTDPPYAVGYVGKTKDALKIQGDEIDREALALLLEQAFSALDHFLVKGAPIYAAHGGAANSLPFYAGFAAAGWHLHQDLVWVKDTMVLGHSDYNFRHEPVFYGWKGDVGPGEVTWMPEEEAEDGTYPGAHGFVLYGWKPGARRAWYGGRTQVSVFNIDRPTRSSFHPTAKPPELIAQMLLNSSLIGSLGFDPFVGYGSTIVAAERLQRLCFAQDKEPKYCAATLERLALFGLSPRLAELPDGERVAES